MNDEINIEISEITSDNKTGSRGLTDRLNTFFLSNFNSINSFREYINIFKKELNAFPGVISYLKNLEKSLPNKNKTKQFLNSFEQENKKSMAVIFSNAKKEFERFHRFLTISNSKTISEVLLKMKEYKRNIEVFICESRPIFEGRVMAELLTKNDMKVTLITEASAAYYTKKIDAVIIGADKILKDHSVVNKIGSLPLAILAKYYNKPFYVISDNNKNQNIDANEEKLYPPDEIWKDRPETVKVNNLYFESIESSLITKIITDK